ncbi:hypothetical protein QBC36DRAFT_62730 [Triangularia setosa]|uniref:Uncharacterized protein n=1 Tax=Triangularia setosa TaxID=2587417 RepID=A0AAN6W0W9_9PEZI|nr:hypothetical protein QBC36DRAFT_62730 [Podospora setosa]
MMLFISGVGGTGAQRCAFALVGLLCFISPILLFFMLHFLKGMGRRRAVGRGTTYDYHITATPHMHQRQDTRRQIPRTELSQRLWASSGRTHTYIAMILCCTSSLFPLLTVSLYMLFKMGILDKS